MQSRILSLLEESKNVSTGDLSKKINPVDPLYLLANIYLKIMTSSKLNALLL